MHVLRTLALLGAALLAGCKSADDATNDGSSTASASAAQVYSGQGGGGADYDALLDAGRFEKEAWRLSLTRVAQRSTVDVRLRAEDGLLLVQDQDAMMHAINLSDGLHRWVVEVPGALTQTPHLGAEGVVLVNTDQFLTVNSSTGSRVAAAESLDLDFWPSSNGIEARGSVYFGRAAPFGVQAVDPGTGLSGWHYDTSSPVVELRCYGSGSLASLVGTTEDGLVFSVAPLRAAGERPRSETWSFRMPSSRVGGAMALDEENVYVGGTDSFLYCIDAANGSVRWKTGCNGPHGEESRPVVAEGVVYVRSRDSLHAFDIGNGAELWSNDAAQRLITRIGERCYLQEGRDCVVVGAADGEEITRFSLSGFKHVPSIQGGGRFVASDGRGQIVCFQ